MIGLSFNGLLKGPVSLILKSGRHPVGIRGFTLVEVMVTVALVGILAAIAIPNYSRMASRARQAEAKLALSAIYAAEIAFATEHSSFSACLQQLGYAPDGFAAGAGSKRYFHVGFRNAVVTNPVCGPTGDVPCNTFENWSGGAGAITCAAPGDGTTYFSANSFANSGAGLAGDGDLMNTAISAGSFVAAAGGQISMSGTGGHNGCDIWEINQNKVLVHSFVSE